MTSTGYEQITYEVAEEVATITLDRPEALNAFTVQMGRELIVAFDRVDGDDNVRAVIVTGRGRGYCAGADLSSGGSTFDVESRGGPARADDHLDEGGLVALRIFECLKPVIAAINGPAVGVGITTTLPMDVRLASTQAKFGFVFTRRGMMPDGCASWFLPRVVGITKALEWVAAGRVFGPQEALDAGLLSAVHEPDELLGAAHAIAREIADNTASVSVAASRRLLWQMLSASHPSEAHRAESVLLFERGRSADVREGIASFLEKRPPTFPMRVSADAAPLLDYLRELAW